MLLIRNQVANVINTLVAYASNTLAIRLPYEYTSKLLMLRIHKQDAYAANIADERNMKNFMAVLPEYHKRVRKEMRGFGEPRCTSNAVENQRQKNREKTHRRWCASLVFHRVLHIRPIRISSPQSECKAELLGRFPAFFSHHFDHKLLALPR